jgi:hypothetical protein
MKKLNLYDKIKLTSELLSWNKTEINYKNVILPRYEKIILTGECSLHDYDTNCYCLRLSILFNIQFNNRYSVRVSYITIDDGDFGGWIHNLDYNQAIYLLNEIKNVYDTIYSLPSDDEMNEKLDHLGIIIEYE